MEALAMFTGLIIILAVFAIAAMGWGVDSRDRCRTTIVAEANQVRRSDWLERCRLSQDLDCERIRRCRSGLGVGTAWHQHGQQGRRNKAGADRQADGERQRQFGDEASDGGADRVAGRVGSHRDRERPTEPGRRGTTLPEREEADVHGPLEQADEQERQADDEEAEERWRRPEPAGRDEQQREHRRRGDHRQDHQAQLTATRIDPTHDGHREHAGEARAGQRQAHGQLGATQLAQHDERHDDVTIPPENVFIATPIAMPRRVLLRHT